MSKWKGSCVAIFYLLKVAISISDLNNWGQRLWYRTSGDSGSFIKRSRIRIVQDHVDFEANLFDSDQDESSPLDTREIVSEPSVVLDRVASSLKLPVSTHINSANDNDTSDSTSVKGTLRSTGTTIAGLVLPKSGIVILGADTRATDDRMVADKYCSKIHPLTSTIFACGAGTSGDLEAMARQCKYSMKLQQLQQESIGNYHSSSATAPPTAINIHQVLKFLRDPLYETGGALGVNLILGGAGGTLVALHPHGSFEQLPYAALGSGGLAAMAVLEQGYRPNLSLRDGKALIEKAIGAGIDNDLGSGSQVDLCVIHPSNEVEYLRAAVPEQELLVEKYSRDAKESSGGVNGFGNLPYEELSRQTVKAATGLNQEAKHWNEVLGL